MQTKKFCVLFVMAIAFSSAVTGYAQQKDNEKLKKEARSGEDREDSLVKAGQLKKIRDREYVMVPSSSPQSLSVQKQRSPSGVKVSAEVKTRVIVKEFNLDRWIWGPQQDTILVRNNSDIEVLDLNTGVRKKEMSLGESKGWQPLLLSPDGKGMVFFEGGATYLYSFPAKTTTLLLPQDKGRAFAWSPDSKRIAYDYEDAVWVVDVESEVAKSVSPKEYWGASWLAKSDRIKVGKRTERGKLLVIDLASGKMEQSTFDITEGNIQFENKEKVLILKGKKISIRDLQTKEEVFVGNRANDNPANNVGDGGSVVISPDSDKIAYEYTFYSCDEDWEPGVNCPNIGSNIYIFDIKTGKTINATNTQNKWLERPQWSKDGKRIFYLSKYSMNDEKPALMEIQVK